MGNQNITTFGLQTKVYTEKEQRFLQMLRAITPQAFTKNCANGFDQDIRLLGLAALALEDLNHMPPCENYTFNTLPESLFTLLIMGTEVYIALFTQMRYSLIDISYSDGGLSVNLDRVGKINTSWTNLEKTWLRILENYKKCLLLRGGIGLGTPRFQSNLSRFIGMLGNGAFGWNIP